MQPTVQAPGTTATPAPQAQPTTPAPPTQAPVTPAPATQAPGSINGALPGREDANKLRQGLAQSANPHVATNAEAILTALQRTPPDFDKVLITLSRLNAEQQKAIAEYFKTTHKADLDEMLKTLPADDLAIAQKLRAGAVPGSAEAIQIYLAGNDPKTLLGAIQGKTPGQLQAIYKQFEALVGRSIRAVLRDRELPTDTFKQITDLLVKAGILVRVITTQATAGREIPIDGWEGVVL